ncbi:VOC family protein [Filobacillus milosensis]|uniref:VOC family protein n=1 Tax=Filobacillus milosensis TaxID=94137 RepID=A0A4Y8ITJ1_9BACI|nr:VOC family protein [Filobacillus milosensis]TFB24236.1 VOC family protein [Filobacillus milosensis]
MSSFISHIGTVEIPVSNLKNSIKFYTKVLEVEVIFEGEKNAMLSFNKKGVPTIFLVETDKIEGVSFHNTNSDVEHTVIDFYTESLEDFRYWLTEQDVEVGPLNVHPENGMGGFGFKDPDGNKLSVTNVLHKYQ